MPQLRPATVKRVFLPSFEDVPEDQRVWVDLETPARMTDFSDVDQSLPQILQTASVIAFKIKDWNVTDDKDTKVPVTAETVASLDAVDFATLTMALGLHKLSMLTPQKKTI